MISLGSPPAGEDSGKAETDRTIILMLGVGGSGKEEKSLSVRRGISNINNFSETPSRRRVKIILILIILNYY